MYDQEDRNTKGSIKEPNVSRVSQLQLVTAVMICGKAFEMITYW